jgi:hypothetical protein
MLALWGAVLPSYTNRAYYYIHTTKRLPSGRVIAVYMDNLCLENIYAPLGSANRAEREYFFNTEVVELSPHSPTRLIWGEGGF